MSQQMISPSPRAALEAIWTAGPIGATDREISEWIGALYAHGLGSLAWLAKRGLVKVSVGGGGLRYVITPAGVEALRSGMA